MHFEWAHFFGATFFHKKARLPEMTDSTETENEELATFLKACKLIREVAFPLSAVFLSFTHLTVILILLSIGDVRLLDVDLGRFVKLTLEAFGFVFLFSVSVALSFISVLIFKKGFNVNFENKNLLKKDQDLGRHQKTILSFSFLTFWVGVLICLQNLDLTVFNLFFVLLFFSLPSFYDFFLLGIERSIWRSLVSTQKTPFVFFWRFFSRCHWS